MGATGRLGWFLGALITTLLLDFGARFFCGVWKVCARCVWDDIVGVGVGCGGS